MVLCMARIEPTRDQLQAAFQRLRRAGWPATLDAAMAEPVRAALLHGDAVRHALNRPTTLPRRLAPVLLRPPPALDRKRAAAGDTDDDDDRNDT